MESFRQLLEHQPTDPRTLTAVARGCQELRQAGNLIHLAAAASVARELRLALEEGRFSAADAADLDLAPSLDDLRRAIVFEAQETLAWIEQDLPEISKLAAGLGLLSDDWQRLRVGLAERALVAAESASFSELADGLGRLEAADGGTDSPVWLQALYGDRILVDLTGVHLAKVATTLGDEAAAWETLREGAAAGS